MAAFSFRRALAASIVQSALHAEVAVAAPLRYNVVAELPLNETGYKQAVAMKSDGVMKEFIRRLVAKFGFGVGDEGVLSGFATHWANATQDYQHLEREVRAVPWFPKDGEMSPLENTTEEVATEVAAPEHAKATSTRRLRLKAAAAAALEPTRRGQKGISHHATHVSPAAKSMKAPAAAVESTHDGWKGKHQAAAYVVPRKSAPAAAVDPVHGDRKGKSQPAAYVVATQSAPAAAVDPVHGKNGKSQHAAYAVPTRPAPAAAVDPVHGRKGKSQHAAYAVPTRPAPATAVDPVHGDRKGKSQHAAHIAPMKSAPAAAVEPAHGGGKDKRQHATNAAPIKSSLAAAVEPAHVGRKGTSQHAAHMPPVKFVPAAAVEPAHGDGKGKRQHAVVGKHADSTAVRSKGVVSAAPSATRAPYRAAPKRPAGDTPSFEVPTPGKARRVNRRLSRLSRDAQSAVQGRTVYGSLDAFHIKTERSHSEEFAPSPLSQLRGEKTHHHRSRALKKTAPTKRAPSLQAKSEPLRHLHEVVSKFGKDARKAVRDQKRAVEDFRHSLRVSLLGVESGSENGARQAVASNATQQTLPAVREVLSTASKSLTDFSADTNHIRKQVEQRQKLLRDKMVVAKDRFEAKLNAYKNQHANLTMVNYELRESIRSVNKTNLALVANASATQRSIRILQDAIVSLRQKVLHAQGFLDDSLNETDFSNATEVQILVPTTPEPSLENFLTKARRELGLKSHSVALLGQAVSVKAKRTAFDSDVETDERGMPKAERMTSMLLDSLENLEKAEMNAYHTLKTNYQSSKEKWVARLTSLLAEQAELKGQLDAVTQMTVELQTANQVVDGTCVLLIRKLEDFGTFLSHVDDAAKKTVAKAKEQGAAQ